MHGQERIHAVFNRVTRDWTKLGLLEAVPVHCRGLECMNSVCSPDADCPSDLLWPRGGACPPGLSPASDSPGLNRTMARRQPSSDLSICMSFILDTSSVKTLHGGDMGEHTIRDVFPLKNIWDRHWGHSQFFSAGREASLRRSHAPDRCSTSASSNIQGPEHEICSCSLSVQHAALTICTPLRKTTWVFSTFYCAV